MRKLVPIFLLFFVVLGTAGRSSAETRGSHAEPEDSPSTVVKPQPKSQPATPTQVVTTTPVTVLTRQEALIKGLREANLSPQAMKALVKATENQPKMDAQKFNAVVNDLAQKQRAISQEQAEKLQELFTNELGSVLDSPVGTELNLAAKRALDGAEKTTTPPPIAKEGTPDDSKNPLAGANPNAAGPNGTNPAGITPLDNFLNKAFGGTGESPFGAAKGAEDPNSLAAKQFALTQNLLKNLDESRERRRSRDREGLGDGLLQALRGAFGDQNRNEGGNNNFGRGFDRDRFADNHGKLPEPPRREDRDKDKKEEPFRPQRRDEDRDRDRGLGNLAALFKNNKDGGGNSDKNNKDQKGEEKFQLPESKVKDSPDTAKKSTPPSVDKKDPVDPSAGLDPDQLADDTPPPPQTSPLQGISPTGMGGGFGGEFGGFSGGGGTFGPNIIGSASPPAGGGFDGDPFSGLGGGFGEGGGPPGGYQFSKSVAYGAGGGSSAEGGGSGEVDGGGGGFETPYNSATRSSASAGGRSVVLVLSPSDDTKKSLFDYFGKLRSTLCGEPGGVAVEVCKKIASRNHLRTLRQAGVR